MGKTKLHTIQNQVREHIRIGLYRPGEKLGSARDLAEKFAANRHTVMAALQQLIAEGWLCSVVRQGYFVEEKLPIEHSATTSQHNLLEPISPPFAEVLPLAITSQVSNYRYHFGGGLPDIDAFAFDSFRRSMSVVCRQASGPLLHYGEVSGVIGLKQQVLHYLRHARSLDKDDVLICNGSQEALSLIAQTFIRQGDGVAIEALGYPPARNAFAACGARLVAIAQTSSGICTTHLKEVLASQTIKLLYLTPLHQYPTTVTLSAAKRLEIYQLCYQHGVLIVEDDYDHEFHYACQPLQPMAASDPAEMVIYLSTFSKVMFAGIRTGYVCASKPILAQLVARKQLMNHCNEALTQMAIAHWMQEGHFERHLRKMTKLYRQRRDAMVAYLQSRISPKLPLQFDIPDGGMALWVDVGKPITNLKGMMKSMGVYVQTESEFCVEPPHKERFIRLGFASQSTTKALQGLAILLSQIEKEPE
ncbi:Transcriptional regulator, GntR family domain / Aspartate aminotransferase [Pseudoalteromonas luteoviolacea B = ATCC 29581]|nr:Transcriptional regulator, GntR family domain / Aspartate aminotransferase [Pseudoalteromonas luteoviolacea B = ATCC 29581]